MSRVSVPNIAAFASMAFGVVAIITRPFLFAPIGMLLLLFAARQSEDHKLTRTTATVLSLCALAGAAIAAAYSKPLY